MYGGTIQELTVNLAERKLRTIGAIAGLNVLGGLEAAGAETLDGNDTTSLGRAIYAAQMQADAK